MVIKGFQWDSKEEDEMEGGNEAGSFVWEVFICSLALRQQHCSYPALQKSSCFAPLLALIRNIRACPASRVREVEQGFPCKPSFRNTSGVL